MEYNHSNDIMQSNVQKGITNKTLLFALYYPMFSVIDCLLRVHSIKSELATW